MRTTEGLSEDAFAQRMLECSVGMTSSDAVVLELGAVPVVGPKALAEIVNRHYILVDDVIGACLVRALRRYQVVRSNRTDRVYHGWPASGSITEMRRVNLPDIDPAIVRELLRWEQMLHFVLPKWREPLPVEFTAATETGPAARDAILRAVVREERAGVLYFLGFILAVPVSIWVMDHGTGPRAITLAVAVSALGLGAPTVAVLVDRFRPGRRMPVSVIRVVLRMVAKGDVERGYCEAAEGVFGYRDWIGDRAARSLLRPLGGLLRSARRIDARMVELEGAGHARQGVDVAGELARSTAVFVELCQLQTQRAVVLSATDALRVSLSSIRALRAAAAEDSAVATVRLAVAELRRDAASVGSAIRGLA